MSNQKNNHIGGQWLCDNFNLHVVNPLAVVSNIGSRRHTVTTSDGAIETYQEIMRPEATLRGHLTFHLKHEAISLEMLSRLFEKTSEVDLANWIAKEPTSQYAKRACFLFEWFTGKEIDLHGITVGGNYFDVLDPDDLVVAGNGKSDSRWRVRDNMPGTREFCPTVRRTDAVRASMDLDCQAMLNELKIEFGSEMLLKSAVWLTLRESRASFKIEGEEGKKDRIQRFADVLHSLTGQASPPLDQKSLAMLQSAILGVSTSIQQPGIRKSPVFIGQAIRYQEVVHYVAPPAEDVVGMLDGIREFLNQTTGQSSIMRAAVASFGFVYVHPLADGNGRVHRFLINDILRRDGAVPEPLIIPVSGLITRDAEERKAYDQVLDSFSKPLMRAYASHYRLVDVPIDHDDGISSNFIFDANEDARHAWRFVDLTSHVQYAGCVIEKTIHQEMRKEAVYLRSHFRAREVVKNLIEMPDHQVDRVIRSIDQNNGALSGVLVKEVPILGQPGVWEKILDGVRTAFSTLNDEKPIETEARDDLPMSQS